MIDVISLGAGVQSTTMALMAAHGEIEPMPAAEIFADTGAEPRRVYEHLDWLRSGNVLPFPVHVIQFSHMTDDLRKTARGEGEVAGRTGGYVAAPFFTINKDGSRGMLRRECTQNYKIRPIEKGLKELLGRDPKKAIRSRKPLVRTWIGISSDEWMRVKHLGPKWQTKWHPLIDRHTRDGPDHQNSRWISRQVCIDWMQAHDYPIPAKSACVFCPYHSNAEWRAVREDPADWGVAVEIDGLLRGMAETSRAGLRKGGQLYAHADRVPLADADIEDEDPNQLNLWASECEGMCGL